MTIASAEIRTGTPRRKASSHRPENRHLRAWCIYCGTHRDIIPAGGDRAHPVVNGHTVYEQVSRSFVPCPGAWAELIPDADPLAHWSFHDDDCRTAAGLWCVCPLQVLTQPATNRLEERS